MLSDEEIWKFWWARPDVPDGEDDSMEAQFIAAARAVEREATAPLIERISLLERKLALVQQGKFDERMYQAGIEQEKQIKEDEALMRDVLEVLMVEPEMREYAYSVAIGAIRERLEAKS